MWKREMASITVDICICLVTMNECGDRKKKKQKRRGLKEERKGKKIIHKGEKKLMEGKLINLI